MNYELVFSLPKGIADQHLPIRLPFTPNTGYVGYDGPFPDVICCIEDSKHVEGILPLITKWFYDVFSIDNDSFSKVNSKTVDAELYAYNSDGSLFGKWDITGLFPLDDVNTTSDSTVEFKFKIGRITSTDT